MVDTEVIKQKIQSLESKARELESDMVKLVNEIQVIPYQELICAATPWDPADYFYGRQLGKPTVELAQFQRKLLREYNEWYHQAVILINLFCPDKEDEFKNCYKGMGSFGGILKILNLDAIFPEDFDNAAILRRLLEYFDAQRAILSAISGILPIYRPQKVSTLDSDTRRSSNITNIVIQSQDQSQVVTTEIAILTHFKDLRESIEESDIDDDRKKTLITQLNNLEKSQGTSDFISYYRDFISTIADHISVIQPFIPFLTSLLPS